MSILPNNPPDYRDKSVQHPRIIYECREQSKLRHESDYEIDWNCKFIPIPTTPLPMLMCGCYYGRKDCRRCKAVTSVCVVSSSSQWNDEEALFETFSDLSPNIGNEWFLFQWINSPYQLCKDPIPVTKVLFFSLISVVEGLHFIACILCSPSLN